MKIMFPLFCALFAGLMVAGCSPDAPTIPCPVCYEDEWSKEPFPGQAKQHIKPLTADDLKANGLNAARETIGISSTTPQQ